MRHDVARVGVVRDDVKGLAAGLALRGIAHTLDAIEEQSIDGRSRQGINHRPVRDPR